MLSKYIYKYEKLTGGKILDLRRFHNFLIKGGYTDFDSSIYSDFSDYSSDSNYSSDDEKKEMQYQMMSANERSEFDQEQIEKERKKRKNRRKKLRKRNKSLSPSKPINRIEVYEKLGLLKGKNS